MEFFYERGRLERRRGGLDLRWTERHHDPLLPEDRALGDRSKRLPATLSRAMFEVIRNVSAALRGKERSESGPRDALRTLHFCATVRTLSHKFRNHA